MTMVPGEGSGPNIYWFGWRGWPLPDGEGQGHLEVPHGRDQAQ
jgi:hypothetical protein